MKTRRRKRGGKSGGRSEPKSPLKTPLDDRIPPSGNGDRGGYVQIHHYGSVPVIARFLDVDTAELLVVEDLSAEVTDETFRDRFVKVAPRIPVLERESFDGPAIAARIRAAGARAVILAPIMVPEIRRVEPEQVVKRTPRETVKAWFGEQKAIDAPSRDAALELVFGFMDEEGL